MLLGSFRYLQTPWTCSTKPFTKGLSRCGGKWTFIFVFFALCSPFAQSLNMVCFAWSWTHSDTFTPCEDASQNRLPNGSAVVKVSPLVFRVFALCSPSAQSLNIAHVAWCWAQSDTFTLREDAPQNCLQNGWAVVEVSPLVFHVFLLMLSAQSLTISDVTAWRPRPSSGARAAFLAPGTPWAS